MSALRFRWFAMACGLPAESLFSREVQSMREAGINLAEVSCVASDCADDSKKHRFETLVKMISLTIHVARRRGTDRLLLAVHPRHAKFYQRMFGCVPCTPVKEYEVVRGNPAVLCVHDFAELDRRGYALFEEVYNSRFSPWQMDGPRMSAAEKQFLSQALQAARNSSQWPNRQAFAGRSLRDRYSRGFAAAEPRQAGSCRRQPAELSLNETGSRVAAAAIRAADRNLDEGDARTNRCCAASRLDSCNAPSTTGSRQWLPAVAASPLKRRSNVNTNLNQLATKVGRLRHQYPVASRLAAAEPRPQVAAGVSLQS